MAITRTQIARQLLQFGGGADMGAEKGPETGREAGPVGGGKGIGGFLGKVIGGFFADGGRPPVGKASIVGERGPELFVPSTAGQIIPNNKMGGTTNNIVVNVDASGSSVEGDDNAGKQLGRLIAVAVQSELIQQKRPGGLLAEWLLFLQYHQDTESAKNHNLTQEQYVLLMVMNIEYYLA